MILAKNEFFHRFLLLNKSRKLEISAEWSHKSKFWFNPRVNVGKVEQSLKKINCHAALADKNFDLFQIPLYLFIRSNKTDQFSSNAHIF